MAALRRRTAVQLQSVALAGVLVAGGWRVLTYVPPEPPPTARDVWQRLLAARSARVDLTVDLAVGGRRAFRLHANGVVETAAGRSSLRVTSSGVGTGDVVYDEVTSGATVYVRPANGRWYSYVSAVETPQRPAGLFVLLADAGELTRAGQGDVRGTRATQWTATVRGGALHVWLDGEGMPRRVSFQQGDSVTTADLYDFLAAEQVVTPPRARPVSDLAEALRRGAR